MIEGKKLVMQGRDAAGLEQVMEESRTLLVRAMARGYTLYLRMTNCAADIIKSYQDPATLPLQVWDRESVAPVLGEDLFDLDGNPLKAVVREDDSFDYDMGGRSFFVHKDFNVVVCSWFAPEEYEEYLTRALPLENLQVIHITETP